MPTDLVVSIPPELECKHAYYPSFPIPTQWRGRFNILPPVLNQFWTKIKEPSDATKYSQIIMELDPTIDTDADADLLGIASWLEYWSKQNYNFIIVRT